MAGTAAVAALSGRTIRRDPMGWARLVKDHRERRGMSITDAALLVGVQRETWSRWEAGRNIPSAANLGAVERFCEAFHVSHAVALVALGYDAPAAPPPRRPVEPTLARLMEILEDDATPERTKAYLRQMISSALAFVKAQTEEEAVRPPRQRRSA